MFDDDDPEPPARFELHQNLDSMSVEEIDDTIALLRSEIERLELARKAKAGHMEAAAALFSKK